MTDTPYLKRREEWFSGRQKEMFLDIGFFINCFNQVDLVLTFILCSQTKSKHLGHFHELVRGMDMRVKIERIRKIGKINGRIGPQIELRFSALENIVCPIRNYICHSSLAHSEDDGPLTYYYFSLHNMPWKILGTDAKDVIFSDAGEITSYDLFQLSDWLTILHTDLLKALSALRTQGAQKILELVDPNSNPQLPSRLRPGYKAALSTTGIRPPKPKKEKRVKLSSAQKRAAKTAEEKED